MTTTASTNIAAAAEDAALRIEARLRRRIFAPPPKLTVSEWADAYRVLSRVASAEPGKWRTSRAPYQREILDAISDPSVVRVSIMSSAQVGKTEIINNAIGYYIDQDPAPILVVQPSLDMARAWSTDRLATMLRETPQLQGRVRESNRRHSADTILHKAFPGGHLTVVGANSAAGLASRPIRVVLSDEVDRYPASAGAEGDPVTLAVKRTATFWNRKIVLTSTPTIKGVSRIEAAYLEGDQRKYYVPCPDCGHRQPLVWSHLQFDPVGYACAGCGVLIPETDKPKMLAAGAWVAQNPGAATASFHLNALYSPWATWDELIAEFHASRQSPERLQVFVNTVLGETWEAGGEQAADADQLAARRETYACEVPDTVGVLTAGVDVQRDRLELLVWGWGAGAESWVVRHERIYGDPESADVWERLDVHLTKAYAHGAGGQLRVRCTCVDSGAFTDAVYRFVRMRQRRGVFATKGSSVRGRPLIGRPSRPNKYGVRVVPLGSDTAKDVLFARLRVSTAGTPGYVHLPRTVDDEFLAQFGAEVIRVRHTKGVPVREYHRIRDRNEAIDLSVLNFAALHLLGSAVYDQLALWVERARAQGRAATPIAHQEPETLEPAVLPPTLPRNHVLRPPGRGGWASRW